MLKPIKQKALVRPLLCSALALALGVGLAGCGGSKEKKSGQALVSVNGEEVTVLQLNEELQRANVPAAQQQAASKQLLESLIDRQLLLAEAVKEKVDRDPKVLQAVERAKALILAQAYLQKKVGTVPRPTKEEVAAYYEKNPQFFSQRKVLEMRQLVLASKDIDDTAKAAIDKAKSLEEAAAWFDSRQVRYARTQAARSTADLPAEMGARLLSMPKGQLFIVREGERSLLITIADVKDAPLSLEASATQIEQFLFNRKSKELADAELARLRAAAKIDYLNKTAEPAAAPAAGAAAPAASPAAPAAPAAAGSTDDANARGVAGLK